MIRRVAAGVIVVALGIGIWMLWPRDSNGAAGTTIPASAASSTTSTTDPTTTSSLPGPTTTTEPDRVVDTVEEAEAILRDLWFGWFEGIYNQDEERIREVVATEEYLDQAISLFGEMQFTQPPTGGGITFVRSEILMSTDECLSIHSTSNVDFLAEGPDREGVDVLRWHNKWKLFGAWADPGDLWEEDCEAQLESLP